jgi:hypothetical protein
MRSPQFVSRLRAPLRSEQVVAGSSGDPLVDTWYIVDLAGRRIAQRTALPFFVVVAKVRGRCRHDGRSRAPQGSGRCGRIWACTRGAR